MVAFRHTGLWRKLNAKSWKLLLEPENQTGTETRGGAGGDAQGRKRGGFKVIARYAPGEERRDAYIQAASQCPVRAAPEIGLVRRC